MDWSGFDCFQISLNRPLLIVRGSKGVLACGYLKVESFTKNGDAGAIVTGVGDLDSMLDAQLVAVSEAASTLGLQPGMTGREALEMFR